MMTRTLCAVAAAIGFCWAVGCVKAPERIEVNLGGGSRPEPVDSSRVPDPQTLEEAKQELAKAYQNLQYEERENGRLRAKADEYKRERDEYKKRLKKYEHD